MQYFNHEGKWVSHEEFLKLKYPEEIATEKATGSYESVKFNDLKKLARGRGITLTNKETKEELLALLVSYDNLKDGDEFQDQIAKYATEEFITENGLENKLKVGDLFFVPKVVSKD
jgi:hypothetical protein